MDNKTACYKIKSDIENSNRIVIVLLILSLSGIMYGILGILFNGIWIDIPYNNPGLITLSSVILFIVSYVVFRHTKSLTEAVRGVGTEF
jgi:hypothetical protein